MDKKAKTFYYIVDKNGDYLSFKKGVGLEITDKIENAIKYTCPKKAHISAQENKLMVQQLNN